MYQIFLFEERPRSPEHARRVLCPSSSRTSIWSSKRSSRSQHPIKHIVHIGRTSHRISTAAHPKACITLHKRLTKIPVSSVLTTQRQGHLNVGSRLGISPIRLRRNEAFRGASGSCKEASAWRSGGLPCLASHAEEACHVLPIDKGDATPAGLGCSCRDDDHFVDSSTLEPFDPRGKLVIPVFPKEDAGFV